MLWIQLQTHKIELFYKTAHNFNDSTLLIVLLLPLLYCLYYTKTKPELLHNANRACLYIRIKIPENTWKVLAAFMQKIEEAAHYYLSIFFWEGKRGEKFSLLRLKLHHF